MSDTMNAMLARWIGRRVAWNHRTSTACFRATGTIIDMTPAELLVDIDNDGGRVWITGDEDGFEVLDGAPTAADGDTIDDVETFTRGTRVEWQQNGATRYGTVTDSHVDNDGVHVTRVMPDDAPGLTANVDTDRLHATAPALAENDAVAWTAYYGGETVYGHIVAIVDDGSAIVRDMGGSTFRVRRDRIRRRTPDASATFTGAREGTGVRITRDAAGVHITAFDYNRAEGGTEPEIALSFGTAHEAAVWLHDQMTNPANDYSATR